MGMLLTCETQEMHTILQLENLMRLLGRIHIQGVSQLVDITA